MKLLFALSAGLTAALLAACGGSQPPISAPVGMPQSRAIAPEAKSKDLLYAADFVDGEVLVFSYPQGKMVGVLTGVSDPQGECTSQGSNGDWWVVASGDDEVLEYAHGGSTPISTLSESTGEPAGCAVDAKTGDLAVTIFSDGDVLIYRNASGIPNVYATPLVEAFFDGYDNKGDLFADGFNVSDAFELVELAKGGNSFKPVNLNQSIGFPGSVQWADGYVTVADQESSPQTIYQFAISDGSGIKKGATPLDDAAGGFWIQGRHVVGTTSSGIGLWKYPAGGDPVRTIGDGGALLTGLTVSVAPR